MAGSTTQVAYSDQAASLLVQSESRNIWQVGRTVSQAILPIFCILWWREAQLLVAKRERWRASLPGWWIKKWMKGWKILPRGRSLNGMHLQREIEMPLLPKVHPDKATLPEESSHFLIWSLSAVLFTILSSSDLGSWSRSQEKRDDHSKGEGSDKRRWWRRPGWIGWMGFWPPHLDGVVTLRGREILSLSRDDLSSNSWSCRLVTDQSVSTTGSSLRDELAFFRVWVEQNECELRVWLLWWKE